MDLETLYTLQAGPTLDALAAEWMGNPWKRPVHGSCCMCQACGHWHDECQCGYSGPDYISKAWEVVDKLHSLDLIVKIFMGNQSNGSLVSCSLHEPNDFGGVMLCEYIDTTPELAICKLALKFALTCDNPGGKQ